MIGKIHSYLSEADLMVLDDLFADVKPEQDTNDTDATIAKLKRMNDPNNPDFSPTVFVSWDDKDINPTLNKYIVKPYARWTAKNVVRHPTDVVFFTHILLYTFVNLPSAVYLYHNFTYLHGFAHWIFTFWCTGSFTLMLHNHIHNGGVLSKSWPWSWLDQVIHYVFGPLMGQTWNTYYYHHIKHHHVEGNGPDDLSSTVRYQRDELPHFLHYVGRFVFLIWLDLPLYFIRKGKIGMAVRAGSWELSSYTFIATMAYLNLKPTIFVLILPFVILRLGLMVGNWGQHALIDEVEPDSDLRSSITLIDVPSNRFCFNDGYHTAHHLNPRRHWRDQPVHFLQSKEAYASGRALVFHNIDYLMMTVKLMQKDYLYLADCLVPIGEQINMSREEIADMLRSKTKKFTEEDIRLKFQDGARMARKTSANSSTISRMLSRLGAAFSSLWKSQAVSLHEKEQ